MKENSIFCAVAELSFSPIGVGKLLTSQDLCWAVKVVALPNQKVLRTDWGFFPLSTTRRTRCLNLTFESVHRKGNTILPIVCKKKDQSLKLTPVARYLRKRGKTSEETHSQLNLMPLVAPIPVTGTALTCCPPGTTQLCSCYVFALATGVHVHLWQHHKLCH